MKQYVFYLASAYIVTAVILVAHLIASIWRDRKLLKQKRARFLEK